MDVLFAGRCVLAHSFYAVTQDAPKQRLERMFYFDAGCRSCPPPRLRSNVVSRRLCRVSTSTFVLLAGRWVLERMFGYIRRGGSLRVLEQMFYSQVVGR